MRKFAFTREKPIKKDSREDESTLQAYKSSWPPKHYLDVVEPVKRLKREGLYEEAEKLLLWAVDVAENESRIKKWDPPPWYYEQLAIIYRRQKEFDKEVRILDRYLNFMDRFDWTPADKIKTRCEKATLLLEKQK